MVTEKYAGKGYTEGTEAEGRPKGPEFSGKSVFRLQSQTIQI